MKMKALAVALLTVVSVNASATLTGNDLTAANAYFAAHPDIEKFAPWIKTGVMDKNTLKEANLTLVRNSYSDANNGYNVVFVSQIPDYTPPVVIPASTLTPAVKPPVNYARNQPSVAQYSEPAKVDEIHYYGETHRPDDSLHGDYSRNQPTVSQIHGVVIQSPEPMKTANVVEAVPTPITQKTPDQPVQKTPVRPVNTPIVQLTPNAPVQNTPVKPTVNATAMKLAQAQQQQKLVSTVQPVQPPVVNASAMKLSAQQQQQK